MDLKRIIVMEDDADLGWLLQLHLEQAGYDVCLTTDGATGLKHFLDDGADLILLDVNLPVMDGLQVLMKVREVSAVPVVVMTAYAWDRHDLRALGLLFEHYLPKPFSTQALVQQISSMVADPVFLPNSHESNAEPLR